jgi:hypothetical protein
MPNRASFPGLGQWEKLNALLMEINRVTVFYYENISLFSRE